MKNDERHSRFTRTAQYGELVEARFLFEALKRQLIVSRPFNGSYYFDFVVCDLAGNVFKKVQVKGVQLRNGRHNGYCIKLRKPNGTNHFNDADLIFACFIEPHQCWYIIPATAVKSTSSVRLYPDRKQGVGYYEKYKEDWWSLVDEKSYFIERDEG